MTWPTVLAALLVYLLGAILTAAAAAAVDDGEPPPPDHNDLGFLGGFSLLWPVLVPFALVYGVVLCIGLVAYHLGRLIRRMLGLK